MRQVRIILIGTFRLRALRFSKGLKVEIHIYVEEELLGGSRCTEEPLLSLPTQNYHDI